MVTSVVEAVGEAGPGRRNLVLCSNARPDAALFGGADTR